MAISQTVSFKDNEITIEIDEGCVSCPLSKENVCGGADEIKPTHDYSYPNGCPLLDNSIIIKRRK